MIKCRPELPVDLDDQERMAAQIEEVVVHSHLFHAQNGAPGRRDGLLDVSTRRIEWRLEIHPLDLRCREPTSIDLAVRRQRQARQYRECRRHHVVGQPGAGKRSQLTD